MKKCDICQKEYKIEFITTLWLKIGERMGSQIKNNYIEPIDLNLCITCRKERKLDILKKFKSLIPSE